MTRRFTFTIWHGLIGSLLIHGALAAPFVVPRWTTPPEEEPLVVELRGVNSVSQVEEKVVQETRGEDTKDKTETARPEETPPPQAPQPEEQEMPVKQEADRPAPAKAETASVSEQQPEPQDAKTGQAGANNVVGVTERQEAQTIRTDPVTEAQLLRNYVMLMSKKVQANLVYPDDARDARLQGVPVVSFTVLPNGEIRSQTLKIVTSSGKPKLDAGALKTITTSAPFDPPPREMTVVIDVVFGEMDKARH